MVARNYRFGELETRALFALEEGEVGLITSLQLAKLLNVSRGRANKLAWQLARKKRLLRVRKGVYLFAPLKAGPKGYWSENALVLMPELIKNGQYAVSYWAALSHYGLTEQMPISIQVKVSKRRRYFEAFGSKIWFIKVSDIGETKEERISGKPVKFATVEQLIIDCLTHPEHCGGVQEATKALWYSKEKIDWGKLGELALKSKNVVRRRLGFLLELLHLPGLKNKERFAGWRWLDHSRIKVVKGRSEKWGLIINLTEKELMQWQES